MAVLVDQPAQAQGTPATLTPVSGSGQSTTVSTVFPNPLMVIVQDSAGNILPNTAVTFTAPAGSPSSTATAIFGGSGGTVTVVSDVTGTASIPAAQISASQVAGQFNVDVTAGAAVTTILLINAAGPPATITVSQGGGQLASAGSALPIQFTALVVDGFGNPAPGAGVTFTAPSSGASGGFSGSFTALTTTNASGLATAPAFTLNASAGTFNVVANTTVRPMAQPANFNVVSLPGGAARLVINQGSGQSTPVTTAFGTLLRLLVTDANNNPVPNIDVTFIAPASGASATFAGSGSVTVQTDASGFATATTLTANATAGAFNVTATFSGGPTVNVALTNTPGAPASIAVQNGDNQSATISLGFATALSAIVRDGNGNTISNAIVTFAAPGSGASGRFGGALTATATTNASGIALATTFTANTTVGSYIVTVTFGALSASFTLTNIAPGSIVVNAGSGQSTTITTAFVTPLSAKVSDASGAGIAGLVVTFTAPASGASGAFGGASTVTATTNASGIATAPIFMANTIAGSFTVTASVAGVAAPANFSLTGDNPAGIAVQAGSSQQATVNTAFPTRLTARVTNSAGAGVPGLVVTFTASGSGASGTFTGAPTATATTNANGDAQATVLTANGTAGAHTVNATVTGVVAPAAFGLTNLTPTPASMTASPANATPQTAAINTAFGTALGVLVKDLNGIALSGQTVTFTVNPVGGAGATFAGGASTMTATTNGSGIATAPTLTANGTAGTYTVTATAGSVTFMFTLTNQAPAAITVTAGASQSAVINTNYAIQLQATVVDAPGNPVAGVTVTFAAPATGASGTFAGSATTTAVTSASGVATASVIRANGTGGSFTATASVAGVGTQASFNLTNTVPATVTATTGTPQSAAIGTGFATRLQATVTDAAGNPVSGATVSFTAPASGASGTFGGSATTTATTNASGIATAALLTANGTTGAFTVSAAVAGIAVPAAYSLTNNLATPATATASPANGTPQSTAVNTAFATALGVLVRDSGGAVIVGIPVTFAVNAVGGASATFAGGSTSATIGTNAAGIATAPALTANNVAGSYTVTATAGSLTITFTLANTALPATITATAGNNQSQTISTNFATQLRATVLDGSGNPVAGAVVLFAAPTTGARATFGGVATTTATTNASGVATAPVASAGTVAGSYPITATVQGTSVSTSFALTNAPGPASTIARVSGNGQSSALGADFTQPLVAVVRDTGGNPVPGVSVTFTAPSSGAKATFPGAVASATVTTDASGNATSPVLTAAGATGSVSVSAKVNNSAPSVSFTLTSTAAVPGIVALQGGSSQTTAVNTGFGATLQAKVTDTLGNPVANATVTFSLPSTGASASFGGALTATATTNASGIASSPALRANTTAGTFFAQAAVSGIASPAIFTLTNTPDTPVAISIVQGTPQSTIVGTAFAAQLVAQVKDVYGNVVPGAAVTFLAPTVGSVAKFAGGNTANVTTNSTGNATAPVLTANAIAGNYTVTASITTGSFVNFNLTNTPAPAAIAATGGGSQSTRVTTAFASPLQVTVKDASSFPVAGVTVTFAPPASGASASLSANSATTDVTGVATVVATANATTGSFAVTATVPGLATPATFSLTNTVGSPATISATGGGVQAARVMTAFGASLQVTVKDGSGNPVSGTIVTFAAPGSGASAALSATTATTDASGIAAVTATANATRGTYAVSAAVTGIAAATTFNLTNTVSAPATITVTGGGTQSTRVTMPFAAPLQINVKDGSGNPLSGVAVNFAAPATGATATLSAVTAMTDAAGNASVTATANATVGTFAANASVAGVAAPATFNLTNAGTAGLQLSVAASPTRISGPGQTVVFSYSLQNSGNLAVSGITADDSRLSGIRCLVTALAPGASTVCSASTVSTAVDITSGVGIVSVARATGTSSAGSVVSAAVTTTVGIDVDAIRQKTVAANRELLQRRAQVLTSMSPNAQRLQNRLSAPIFGDDPAADVKDTDGGAKRAGAPGSDPSGERRHEPLKMLGAPADGASTGGWLAWQLNNALNANRDAALGGQSRAGGGAPPLALAIPGNDRSASRDDGVRASTSAPFSFDGAAENGAGRFNFAGSLSQLRKSYETEDAAKLASAADSARSAGLSLGLGQPVGAIQRKQQNDVFDMWVEAQSSYFTNGRGDDRTTGRATVLYTGADLVVAPGVLIGFMYQRDWLRESSSLTGQDRGGSGWMVGPYLGLRLTTNIYFDARYARGSASNSVNPIGAYTDTFASSRELAMARLTGNWNRGAWQLRPSLEVTYFSEQQKAYVNQIGIGIPDTRVSLGRAMFGPEVGYRFKLQDKSEFTPYLGIKGVWDFAKDVNTTPSGTPVAPDTLTGRVEAGASYRSSEGITVRATGAIDGIGGQGMHGKQGQVFFVLPLN